MTTLSQLQKLTCIRIVDDDEDHNCAMEFLLTRKGWNVKSYLSSHSFLVEDRYSIPGCLVLDVHMPEVTGLQLQELMSERKIMLPIIFLTGNGDIDMAVHTILTGAVDFLQKPVNPKRLLDSIEKACVKSVKNQNPFVFLSKEDACSRLKNLTSREVEVLKLVAQDLPSRVIGERLGISERTVEAHRTSACKKINTHSTLDILQLFDLAGWLNKQDI